ncbi:helix-turn-helix domain-containing protein [Phenylobacterium terrae]|uniref:Helix-turn-helix domain-containing protein n=1 Tax=Phenylobacterium terrae TaxID=2665495 RepID=A0ABW4N661_9CAUL
MAGHVELIRRVEPLAEDWRSFAFGNGVFDSAGRRHTPLVEGVIRSPDDLLMVTLTGGATRLVVTSDCGHRYDGADYAGAVSFVPAGCERRLRLHGVQARWASLALRPGVLDAALGGRPRPGAFTNLRDPVVHGVLAEFSRQEAAGRLDAAYCDSLSLGLAHYLARREGPSSRPRRAEAMPAWRLRRIRDFVGAHLSRPIAIAELAACVGLSVGYFQRSFRAATGLTPLTYLHQVRTEYASRLLAEEGLSVAEAAARVGFVNASHFARVYRRIRGQSPGQKQ